jgi:hypothetical protein
MGDSKALCLTCKFYDDKPPFAGDLPETYGRCTWSPDLSRSPAVTMLSMDLQRANAQQHTRMIPKRALIDRPELWGECAAYDGGDDAAQ